MSLLPLITYQSRTSSGSKSMRVRELSAEYAGTQQGVIALQGSCSPCVAGISICCELTGFPPKLECGPRPC